MRAGSAIDRLKQSVSRDLHRVATKIGPSEPRLLQWLSDANWRRKARHLGLWMLATVVTLLPLYAWLEEFLPACWSGYAVSVVSGIPVTAVWSNLLYWLLDHSVPRTPQEVEAGAVAAHERVWWIAVLVGSFERALITTLVAYDISGSGSFIVTWVGIKMALGWQRWGQGTQYARAAAFIALLGNAVSILFGLGGGIICQEDSW
jgi:hypothetical protein